MRSPRSFLTLPSTVDLLSMRLSRNWRRLLPAVPVRRLEGEPWSQIVVPRVGELWPLNPRLDPVRGARMGHRTPGVSAVTEFPSSGSLSVT